MKQVFDFLRHQLPVHDAAPGAADKRQSPTSHSSGEEIPLSKAPVALIYKFICIPRDFDGVVVVVLMVVVM